MKLIDYYKSLSLKEKTKWLIKTSNALGKSKRTIHTYLTGTRRIQPIDVAKIIDCCEGRVTPYDLRPDFFPEIKENVE